MTNWNQLLLHTTRGIFEIFIKGEGNPLCVTHLYSEFNETGDYFASTFTKTHTVYLVNLRECGDSEKARTPYELSMLETVLDLEAIREALGFEKWAFAGHSTGGMLGIVYSIYFSTSLQYQVIVGATAREYMTFSDDCIYNKNHPQFHHMQSLIEKLQSSDLSVERRNELSVERTSLSLYDPSKYDLLFSQNIRKKMSATRLNFFSREVHIFDVTKKLQLITIPTLLICGKHDVQCPLIYSLEMNQLIPQSTLAIFDKSNHYPFLEEEDLFLEQLTIFLQNQKTC